MKLTSLRRLMASGATIAAVAVAGCAISACGGSSGAKTSSTADGTSGAQSSSGGQSSAGAQRSSQASQAPHTTTQAEAARATPAQSNPDVGQSQAQVAQSTTGYGAAKGAAKGSGHKDAVTRAGRVEKARPTPASSNDDLSTTGAAPPNPCKLVSVAKARAITGNKLAATEAPLGPTCIYRAKGSKAQITLAIEAASLSQIVRHLPQKQKLTVGGRRAYCGRLGVQVLFVGLSRNQILNVTAPCQVAQQFAEAALRGLRT